MTLRAGVLLIVAAALACAMRGGPSPVRDFVRTTVTLAAGTARAAQVVAEVASTQPARERGLGGRERLGRDEGMLFAYPHEAPRTYWMKDCLIGLDIAFVGPDRRILNVATLPAGAGLDDLKIARAESSGSSLYVLETNAGWFERHGIVVGDTLTFDAAMDRLAPR